MPSIKMSDDYDDINPLLDLEYGNAQIAQHIINLFSTTPGELRIDPTFGINLNNAKDSSMTELQLLLLEKEIIKQVKNHPAIITAKCDLTFSNSTRKLVVSLNLEILNNDNLNLQFDVVL